MKEANVEQFQSHQKNQINIIILCEVYQKMFKRDICANPLISRVPAKARDWKTMPKCCHQSSIKSC